MPDAPAAPSTVPLMLTDRSENPADGTVLTTPGHLPDIVIQTMTPLAQVLVRAARTYLQGLVGFLVLTLASRPVAESLGVIVPPGDFLEALKVAAGLAVAPTVISLLQNTGEMLAKIDALFPRARA